MTFKSAAAGLAALVVWTVGVPALAQTDDLQAAQQLLLQGQTDRALEHVDRYLQTRPKDARGRFLRGILLAEQKKPDDAIRVFTELTQDYPELPEPYNNLAVLYASQGQYDKARASLEMAIRTHPSYATAHENLGDIYAKMASQAYDKALQLDKSNEAAQTKLNLIKDLFTTPTRPPTIAMAQTKPAPEVPPAAPATAPEPAPIAAPAPAPVVAKGPTKSTSSGDTTDAVMQTVSSWATAWSNNDVENYLARYAPDFKTPGGVSRTAWETKRKARIAKPRKIEVRVESPKITLNDANRATVTFSQNYRSDVFKALVRKTLILVKLGDQWLIQQELIGG